MKAGFSIKLILYFAPNCPQQIVAPNCPTPNCPRRIFRAELSCAELSGHPDLILLDLTDHALDTIDPNTLFHCIEDCIALSCPFPSLLTFNETSSSMNLHKSFDLCMDI